MEEREISALIVVSAVLLGPAIPLQDVLFVMLGTACFLVYAQTVHLVVRSVYQGTDLMQPHQHVCGVFLVRNSLLFLVDIPLAFHVAKPVSNAPQKWDAFTVVAAMYR